MNISRPWLLVLGIIGLIMEFGYGTPLSMFIGMFSLYIISYIFEYVDKER